MFHVISLPRTASKALVSFLHKEVTEQFDNPLLLDGEPLGEFLHSWGECYYTFDPSLKKPFGHSEDVVYYYTHPKYRQAGNIQFEPVYSSTEGQFVWRPITPTFRNKADVESLFKRKLELLKQVHNGRPFVLKTQFADMLEDPVEKFYYLSDFHHLNKITSIHLTRSDPLDWLCSMTLTHFSGVFIQSQAQRLAFDAFKENPIRVPEDLLLKWVKSWKDHEALKQYCSVHLKDTDIEKGAAIDDKLTLPPQKKKLEFSTTDPKKDYAERIENYSDLLELSLEM